MRATSTFTLVLAVLGVTGAVPVSAATPPASELRTVVVVTRHGIRSPTNPAEMTPYVAYPMATWEVAPGELTPHGARMMANFGASYRSYYATQSLWPESGCPAAGAVYVWADVDERTKATAGALLEGLAPHCGLTARRAGTAVDPLFHALPAVGRADPETASAAVSAYAGSSPESLVAAYGLAFAKLDAILGCSAATVCRAVSTLPATIGVSQKTGLASVSGAVDVASTAVEDFILAYADGKPLAQIGDGRVDRATLLELSQLHTLKFAMNAEPPYVARAQGSNLLTRVLATIDQGATGVRDSRTRAPLEARFVAFAGHDTNLEAFAGMLQLRWLLPGYQVNDTPPGGALVFEVRQTGAQATPFVRTFFEAQSLDHMRELSDAAPERVPVFVPGCPAYDCPVPAFDRIVTAAIDPAFVGDW